MALLNPSQIFGELFLNYDASTGEQNVLKLYLRAAPDRKIKVDIICNEFEYEILYKKAFPMSKMGVYE
jgi:hypothetical protein